MPPPPRILLLGSPGSGKSFYGQMISKTFEVPFYSMGNVLKSRATEEDRRKMEGGSLADPNIVSRVYKGMAEEFDKGMVFDGYPRSVEQVENFKNIITEDKRLRPDFALHFILRRDVIEAKLGGRRECPSCGSLYNCADVNTDGIVMPAILPKSGDASVCDCGTETIIRPDDNSDVVKLRLDRHESCWNSMQSQLREVIPVIDIKLMGGSHIAWPTIVCYYFFFLE